MIIAQKLFMNGRKNNLDHMNCQFCFSNLPDLCAITAKSFTGYCDDCNKFVLILTEELNKTQYQDYELPELTVTNALTLSLKKWRNNNE